MGADFQHQRRREIEQRLAALAASAAEIDARGDIDALAALLEDVGNRFIDLSDWLLQSRSPSIHVDDTGVGGRGRCAI